MTAFAALAALCSALLIAGQPATSKAEPGATMRFVYFIEQGQTERPDVRAAIERQARALQQFWPEQFGGTFALNDPVVDVVRADHTADWYETNNAAGDPRWNRLANVSQEVIRKLASGSPQRFVSYPSTTTSEGRVGASKAANNGGAWMDGDDALCALGEVQTFPYPDGNAANCLGHVAHELGHTYGLDHEGPTNDCMQFGFYLWSVPTGMCQFSAENRAKVRNNPANAGWLEALPADGNAPAIPRTDPPVNRAPASPPAPESSADEGAEMLRLTNVERAKVGCKASP